MKKSFRNLLIVLGVAFFATIFISSLFISPDRGEEVSTSELIDKINPYKDVDCLTTQNRDFMASRTEED